MGTGTSTGGQRRHGLGGHIVFQMRGWVGYAANFSVYQYHRLKSPSSPESNLSELYQRGLGGIIISMPSLCAWIIYGLLQYIKILIFDQLDSCHQFKVAFNLRIMPAENRITWIMDAVMLAGARWQQRCLFMNYMFWSCQWSCQWYHGDANWRGPFSHATLGVF